MLKELLQTNIPSIVKEFGKLTKEKDPYYFGSWDSIDGDLVLRYWFWNRGHSAKNRKRVLVNEIEDLLRHCTKNGTIRRSDFESKCLKTNGDGPCGFAMAGRILEGLDIVEYDPTLHEFRITNMDKALKLVKQDTIESKM